MMFKMIILLSTVIVSIVSTEGGAATDTKGPLSAGGFTLGRSIDNYDLASHEHYVKEVVISDIEGFRKGIITYGTCNRPGEILRIRLKYDNSSYAFFEKLLKQYKEKFGSSPKFIGGSFGNVKAWRWLFTREDGKRINLILQHNLKNIDETIGNTLELGLPDQMIAERECSNKDNFNTQQERMSVEQLESDWNILLPD